MTLLVSVAVMNPDMHLLKRMLISTIKHGPEVSRIAIFNNTPGVEENRKAADSIMKLYSGLPFTSEFKLPSLLIHSNIERKNIGFGAAHNETLRRNPGYDYFAVLNDDIEFFEPWAQPMIKALEAGAMQVNISRGTCNKIDMRGKAWGEDIDEPDYCEASCMMMRYKDAKKYGPFDEAYKIGYYEDTDLSMRIRKNSDKLAAVPLMWVHHRAVTSAKIKDDIDGHRVNNAHIFHKRHNAMLIKNKKGPFIVLRRTGSHGDVFLTTVVARYAKTIFPDTVIGVMTQCPELVRHSPSVDIVMTESFSPAECDYFIDLDNSYEVDFRVSITDAYFAGFYASIGKIPKNAKRTGHLGVPASASKKVEAMIKGQKRPMVVFDLSDSWPGKQWPYRKYVELSKMINKDGRLGIVLIGAVADYTRDEYIECDLDFINQMSMLETAYLLSRSSVFISHEGLTLHLAQALEQLQHIGLYGCTTPELVNDIKLSTWHGVISKAACKGCRHRYAAGNSIICRREHECMDMITAEEVYKKYIEIVDSV